MSDISASSRNIRLLDDLARKDSPIHRIHPLAKLIVTFVYLAAVASFGKYEITALMPFVFYPALIIAFADLPAVPVLKRILLVEPFIVGVGILNIFFDDNPAVFGGVAVPGGWPAFFSILLKGGLAVTASVLLAATTGMGKIAAALRMLGIPRIFVLQLLLTYRYISVLAEEVHRMATAYSLRAPGHKGIHRNAWGSFAGQLVLRSIARAQRIYEAMSLRGFTGEFHCPGIAAAGATDYAFVAGWILFFAAGRAFDIPVLLGSLITGVMK